METENNKFSTTPGNKLFGENKNQWSGRVFGGLVVVAIGAILLAKKMGVIFPYWLLDWPMLLIVIGFYVGVRHSFRGPVWIVMMLIGSVFLLDDITPSIELRDFLLPMVVITVGLVMIFRPKKKFKENFQKDWNNSMTSEEPHSTDDSIDSVTIFGGVKKSVFSKNFRGGEIITIFGGTEINFSQADMPNRIELELTQIFGGAKLIVPPHWRIQTEDIVSIFGGVEDKRPVLPVASYEQDKVLVLKGTNIFGGIDIKSY